jgi:hypothetical protein
MTFVVLSAVFALYLAIRVSFMLVRIIGKVKRMEVEIEFYRKIYGKEKREETEKAKGAESSTSNDAG